MNKNSVSNVISKGEKLLQESTDISTSAQIIVCLSMYNITYMSQNFPDRMSRSEFDIYSSQIDKIKESILSKANEEEKQHFSKIYYDIMDPQSSNYHNKKLSTDLEYAKLYNVLISNISQSNNINVPKCPTCQSTSINKISGLNRATSVGFWGLFSKKINKSFECQNCGYTW